MTSTFDIIVKNLWKHKWKIITNEEVRKILSSVWEGELTNSRVYKTSHKLKNKWHLMSIKKNLFLVTDPKKQPNEDEILINHYRKLLKRHCNDYLEGGWYIGWVKALEFHLQNYSIPENIDIVNTYKTSLEVIAFDKTINYKQYTHRHHDIFKEVKKYLWKIKLWRYSFALAPLELAMLESLHNPSIVQRNLINEYIKTILRKHKKTINMELFEHILNVNKHHVGVNRIYHLSKSIDKTLADQLYDILKRHSFVMNQED